MKGNFILGSDPEFCGYNTINNKSVSLIGLVGGTKENPKSIPIEGCFVQEDNVNAEFTVPPASQLNTLIGTIKKCVEYIDSTLVEKNIKLAAISSSTYDESELDNDIAKMFGCDPSYCAYTYNITDVPSAEEVGNLRSAGLHIHFGWENPSKEMSDYFNFIKLCDAFLGVPSLICDNDQNRRKLYGSLGDFRLQNWGVEYRTLGANMFNFVDVIDDGIQKIRKILDMDLTDFFIEKIDDDLRKLYSEKKQNYNSKTKVWEKTISLYTEL